MTESTISLESLLKVRKGVVDFVDSPELGFAAVTGSGAPGGEILIGRSVEDVFDFVADQRNEPQYNPRMVRAAKITDGSVEKGTVFRSATRSLGRTAEMRIELTGYDRPARLASRTIMRQADMVGTLTFEPAPSGTRMRWSWQVRPRGAVRLLAPLITWMGRRQEQAIWTSMKRYLEASAAS